MSGGFVSAHHFCAQRHVQCCACCATGDVNTTAHSLACSTFYPRSWSAYDGRHGACRRPQSRPAAAARLSAFKSVGKSAVLSSKYSPRAYQITKIADMHRRINDAARSAVRAWEACELHPSSFRRRSPHHNYIHIGRGQQTVPPLLFPLHNTSAAAEGARLLLVGTRSVRANRLN